MTNETQPQRVKLTPENYRDVALIVGDGQPVGFVLTAGKIRDTRVGQPYTFSRTDAGKLIYRDDAGDHVGLSVAMIGSGVTVDLLPGADMLASRAADLRRERAQTLRHYQASFAHRHRFEPGQLVQWKPGMQILKRPGYGEAAVVLEVLDTPCKFGIEPGDARAAERYDLILGVLSDGSSKGADMQAYHYDSRRFQPYQDA